MILPLGGSISEGIFGSGSSGPPTVGIGAGSRGNRTENPRREFFSDFHRFVSFWRIEERHYGAIIISGTHFCRSII